MASDAALRRTYTGLQPTFPDRRDWTLAHVLRTRAAEQPDAVDLLRANGWEADPWETLLDSRPASVPAPSYESVASIFFTSGTTGLSKGVAMPHSQMYFFGEEVVAMTRLTRADTYLAVTP